MKELSQLFKALGDANRLVILDDIAKGNKCGCTLIHQVNVTQPTLSYHLNQLDKVGLTQSRKEGVWRKYSINNHTIDQMIMFLQSLKQD
jgi:ArsR family transcriptional regulator